jgi:hypothetical protein
MRPITATRLVSACGARMLRLGEEPPPESQYRFPSSTRRKSHTSNSQKAQLRSRRGPDRAPDPKQVFPLPTPKNHHFPTAVLSSSGKLSWTQLTL